MLPTEMASGWEQHLDDVPLNIQTYVILGYPFIESLFFFHLCMLSSYWVIIFVYSALAIYLYLHNYTYDMCIYIYTYAPFMVVKPC